ncbi:hypothetical protein BKA70DRAFT_1532521 [Coprinopsis sp. MPI-PUGE-AT-0042]|nr:hypothetical protein BKA70DRAFT_1532521 [Coprinopsis sp. MPI-PUGE-AT-0042]
MSPDSVIWSSPVVGTKIQRQEIVCQKVAKRRGQARAAEQLKEREGLEETTEKIMEIIEDSPYNLGDVFEFIFDPQNKRRQLQWDVFFQQRGRMTRILNWWILSYNSKSGREEVHKWAVDHVVKTASKEAEVVTQEGVLRSESVADASVIGFSFEEKYNTLKNTYANVTTRVLDVISRTSQQVKAGVSESRIVKKQVAVVTALACCLSEHSQRNNLLKRVFGLFLYASGAQRQVLVVLSHVGLSESFSNLTAKISARRKIPGTLPRLSGAILITFGQVYDNINFTEKVVEQVIGRTDAVVSGTATTIWPLHKASAEDMRLDNFKEAADNAGLLEFTDILHNNTKASVFKDCLAHCILCTIVNQGGDGFKKFQEPLRKSLPVTPRKIEVHKTELHPLPTWKIDKSTIVGNAEVDEAVVKELHLKNQTTTWMKYVHIITGDQLSIACLRTLANPRSGNEGGYRSFAWGAWMPGLFHGKIADMHGFFVTHWGKPNAGTRSPGSLSFHNTLLRHLPITLTSLPTFRTCRDLVFVSLYAQVLHCLLLVSGHGTLEEYCEQVDDWATLEQHAAEILERFANASCAAALREEREAGKGGDMVFESAILFLRDALISQEYTDAVKAGDSGHVLLVLKAWALSFRGNGRTKYGYEMLSLIHNLSKVDIIMNNWLLNPTGKPNSFVEVDLVQEHMNFWIKTFYKAHSPNSTWEWLEMISPCIYALRHLATAMKQVLGTDLGTRHAPVDLSRDIAVLMNSLREHGVYSTNKGRKLDNDDEPAVDVMSAGLNSLLEGTALDDYNTTFTKVQQRRHNIPIVDDDDTCSQATSDTNEPPTLPASITPQPVEESKNDIDDIFDEDSERNEIDDALDLEEHTLELLTLEDIAFDMDSLDVEEEELDEGDEEFGDLTIEDFMTS